MTERSKRIFFQIFFVFAACIIFEVFLRFQGYKAGDLRPDWLWLKPVDSLYVIHDFYTNDEGILVAGKSYWAQQQLQINNDGFRGKEFSELDSTKKKILFIGDSFTWGMSARPFQDSSFCDLLAQKRTYEIINLGIPAADPVQYNLIAEKYINQIKPDFVFVVFFMGNDLMQEDRRVIPKRQIYYWTNAGAILADIDGKHFGNVNDAYLYLMNEKYFIRSPKYLYQKIISKSVLLSRLYSFKFRIAEKLEYEKRIKDTSLTKKYLKRIVEIADANKVPLKFLLIPELKEAGMSKDDYISRYADILLDKKLESRWLIPATSKSIYNKNPDGHFNNDGHREYAHYIEKYLESQMNK